MFDDVEHLDALGRFDVEEAFGVAKDFLVGTEVDETGQGALRTVVIEVEPEDAATSGEGFHGSEVAQESLAALRVAEHDVELAFVEQADAVRAEADGRDRRFDCTTVENRAHIDVAAQLGCNSVDTLGVESCNRTHR
ncbi:MULTISPECIES: hypothetical protein [Gordonia]|uniref:hypothetical protein n=1 Tax=Gordonia TaxID=2053 RepID=UPI003F700CB5